MESGLLWFDDHANRELADKVARAVAHYQHKFGCTPNTCYVHPDALKGNGKQTVDVGGVAVKPRPSVLRHHFWLGTETDGKSSESQKPPTLLSRVAAEVAAKEPLIAKAARALIEQAGTADG